MRRLLATALLPYAKLRNTLSPGLRVLMYHRVAHLAAYDQLTVSPARFAQQMQELSSHKVVSLEDGLRAIQAGPLRKPLFAVTFDDGYLDNLTEALPILQRYRIPATIFVTTQFCDQALSHPRYGSQPTERLHLNWDEVIALARSPGITIGSHTRTHPYLPTISDALAQQEIATSRSEIAAHLQQPVQYFCYPSGDLSPRELQLVRQAGYAAAVSVAPGVNRRDADLFQLKRTEITDRDDMSQFRLKIAGAFDPIHRLLHARRTRRFAQKHLKPSASFEATTL
ncbi:MAG TPA: polysaccharide deacetylase family protein [Thiomonas arsenitoxydans]|uniref:polysaccharide deacetylase family protein n=1 Tax=Thiomonas arsenitoxydans (strain DSM 22701 / CIP 110005 / 3As) TaxID=426114 RepID=UPI002BF85EA0|nr:polysaccharide deacetylase family protein [Thiomonas arsenitoxydans]HML83133.1 polysaccharide deacetylase family protein [Thiomonas arsenitoxydans]